MSRIDVPNLLLCLDQLSGDAQIVEQNAISVKVGGIMLFAGIS